MNTSTKIFATLALSAAVGEKIKKINESGIKYDAGERLREAGHIATGLYPYHHLSGKKIEAVGRAVENLLNEPMEPQDIMSMLLAGLSDICAFAKHDRVKIINPVISELQFCLDLHDEIDHELAFSRYQKWVES